MRTLLCLALLSLLQSGLGKQVTRNVKPGDGKFNSSVLIHKPQASQHKILLNLNSKLQEIFQDHSCHLCSDCMERAVRVHKVHSNKLSDRPMLGDLQKELLKNKKNSIYRHKHKRDVQSVLKINTNKTKKEKRNKAAKKCKKNKHQKTVNVTKYASNNVTYALQVKESNASGNFETCQIYTVERLLPCNISEKDILLEVSKIQYNKKIEKENEEKEKENKKNKEQNEKMEEKDKKERKSRSNDVVELYSETERLEARREIDDGQIPENVRPSVEDFF